MTYRMAVRALDVAIRELADRVREEELTGAEAVARLQAATRLLRDGGR